MSAILGALIMLWSLSALITTYLPQYAHRIPSQTLPRLIILVSVSVAGMLVQRFYFWPGKGQKKQHAPDSGGELATA